MSSEKSPSVLQEYQKFSTGASSAEDFRRACLSYLLANPAKRETLARWLESKVSAGGSSAVVAWQAVADLLVAPAVTQKSAQADGGGAGSAEGPLRVGSVLKDGRYTLVEELGSGGTGQVFKARDRLLEREGEPRPFVALKALNAVSFSDTGARNSLTYEAMRVKKLSHDNIIRVDGFDYEGRQPFITMEYLNGASLDVLLTNQYAQGLQMAQAWPIIASIGSALEYAHKKGVIHSDVKPSNVFVTRKNVVKVVDFGISRPMPKDTNTETETGSMHKIPADRLTAAYAAVEQFYGMPPDPADDVYSFAVVIYELLTGKYPFDRRNTLESSALNSVAPRIDFLSRQQWDGLRRAMAFRRADRTKTVTELLRCLAPQSFARKHRAKLLAISAAAIAGLSLVGYRMIADYLERKMLPPELPMPRTPVKLTPEQQHTIDDSLFLADDDLADMKVTLQPSELVYGLTEGANNVNQILDSVLALDAGNEHARADKARIADLLLQKVRQLEDSHQFTPALMLASEGLKVQPNNLDLFRAKRELCERLPGACAN